MTTDSRPSYLMRNYSSGKKTSGEVTTEGPRNPEVLMCSGNNNEYMDTYFDEADDPTYLEDR